MRIFRVAYSTEEKAINSDYVICDNPDEIKGILSKRKNECEDEIEISRCNEISMEQVYTKDLTIADFLRLTKDFDFKQSLSKDWIKYKANKIEEMLKEANKQADYCKGVEYDEGFYVGKGEALEEVLKLLEEK